MDWNKMAVLTIFVMLPSFAPFEDELPFYSHRSLVKQLISLLRFSKESISPQLYGSVIVPDLRGRTAALPH